MDNKISFLYASVTDIQSTIRAIDAKIGILLIFILFPLTNLPKIVSHIENIIRIYPSWYIYLITIIFIFSWFASILIVIKAISAIDNPANHIVNSSQLTGVFYCGDLFVPEITDAFFNRDVLKATRDVTSHFESISSDKESLAKELAFEQMKLVYIREIKIHRLKWSLYFTYSWLILGLVTYLISLYS